MTKVYGIQRLEDSSGSNFVVKSSLKSYAQKSVSENFSIKAVKRGTEHYTIDGQYYPLGPDQFIVVSPGQHVEVEIESSTDVKGTCYFLSSELINQIAYAYTSPATKHLEQNTPPDFHLQTGLNNIPIHFFRTHLDT